MKRYIKVRKNIFVLQATAILFTILLASCQKEKDIQRDNPRIRTFEVVNIDSTGATFRGAVFGISPENGLRTAFYEYVPNLEP